MGKQKQGPGIKLSLCCDCKGQKYGYKMGVLTIRIYKYREMSVTPKSPSSNGLYKKTHRFAVGAIIAVLMITNKIEGNEYGQMVQKIVQII
jgi:hypothetical protein